MKRSLSLIGCGIAIAFCAALALSQVPAGFLKSGLIFGNAGAQGSGSFVLVEEHTAASSAALNFTTCLTATYDDYDIEFVSLLPASGSNDVMLQVSTNGGSTYDTA